MVASARQLCATAIVVFSLASCGRPAPQVTHAAEPATSTSQPTTPGKREIRLTGTVEAVRSSKVLVPQIFGPGGPMTLTKLINNGVTVKAQDLVAVFDSTAQVDAARAAQAKYDDLGHQAEQKRAQNRADAETRMTALRQAEADFAKSEMELKKGPVLSEIDLEKAKVRIETAREHVASLKKSNALRDRADAAQLRILELQRDRQKVALDRAQTNIARLQVKAPLDGMVAHQNVWRN